MKIYHAADIHLGRRRLDGKLPDSDIAEAFRFIASEAIRDKADVFLLAGDLFDRPQVEPPHLRQAQHVLRTLKDAGIPVIAIEGNHDRHFSNTPVASWLNFLAEDELLILLRPEFNADGAQLHAWGSTTRRGAYVDHDGMRFVGAGYLGAATPHKIRQIVAAMDSSVPTVLLLHAGPEYFVGEGGGFSKDELAALEQKICYLALGHIHKPMLHGAWACNPGSPENCDLREAAYCRGKNGAEIARGYAVVEVVPKVGTHPSRVEIKSNPRRACHRIDLDCSEFGNKLKNGAAAFVDAAVEAIENIKPGGGSVVELALCGQLNLNRIVLDLDKAADEIATAAKVFTVSIDPSNLNIGQLAIGSSASAGASIPRDQLERQSILQLVNERAVWGLGEQRTAFADLFYELKESVRLGKDDQSIAGHIGASALVEQVRAARLQQSQSAATEVAQ